MRRNRQNKTIVAFCRHASRQGADTINKIQGKTLYTASTPLGGGIYKQGSIFDKGAMEAEIRNGNKSTAQPEFLIPAIQILRHKRGRNRLKRQKRDEINFISFFFMQKILPPIHNRTGA